jgi:antitoxin StbD
MAKSSSAGGYWWWKVTRPAKSIANCSVSTSELKENPTALLNEADGGAIAIINNNEPVAYLVPPEMYEWLMETVDDYELGKSLINDAMIYQKR